MAEKDVLIKEKVQYSGYADFKNAYNFAYNWLKDESYNIVEEKYSEKVKGEKKDIEIVWIASKKLTEYFKVELSIKWRILGLEDVEIEIDGKKKKTNKFVEIGIEIKGTLARDYDNKWNKSDTTRFFNEVYNKYVIPDRTKQMEGIVEKAVQELKEEIKAFFELTGKK